MQKGGRGARPWIAVDVGLPTEAEEAHPVVARPAGDPRRADLRGCASPVVPQAKSRPAPDMAQLKSCLCVCVCCLHECPHANMQVDMSDLHPWGRGAAMRD